jgi:hypothetical protein
MKMFFAIVAATSLSAATYAQGYINFATRDSLAGINAPFLISDLRGPGPSWSAQLYRVDGFLVAPLLPATTFLSDPPGGGGCVICERYVSPVVVTVPDGNPGDPVTIRMRAWPTSEGWFDQASIKMESGDLSLVLGTATNPGNLPTSFTGVTIPEPSGVGLFALAGGALFCYRRR